MVFFGFVAVALLLAITIVLPGFVNRARHEPRPPLFWRIWRVATVFVVIVAAVAVVWTAYALLG